MINMDHEATREGPYLARVLQNQPNSINFRVHFGDHKDPTRSPGSKNSNRISNQIVVKNVK